MAEQPSVFLTLVIETDQAPEDVQLAVMAALSDRHKILTASVTQMGGDNDPRPEVTFVVCPVRGLLRSFVDNEEGADVYAKAEGAVTVGFLADADHRGEVTV